MPRLSTTMLAAVMVAGSGTIGHAQQGTIDKAAADAFEIIRRRARKESLCLLCAALRRGPSGTASEAEGLCHATPGDG